MFFNHLFLVLCNLISLLTLLDFQIIPDFRYNTARIEAITKLPNGTLIVISNGYYWFLSNKEYPNYINVRGRVTELYPVFKKVNAIFTDPINELFPKLYLISTSHKNGLMVACKEDGGNFKSDNRFCHLPVDKNWNKALKDLNLKKSIDGATWRNRSKDIEGGFWEFIQGKKLSVIDPYKMELRLTYDIQLWMKINETITALYYDYHKHCYHLFFDNNKYFIWSVNSSLMNRLPMGWDRAFLHGSLSREMKINRDFFKIPIRELINYNQPNFVWQTFQEDKELVDEEIKDNKALKIYRAEKENDIIKNQNRKKLLEKNYATSTEIVEMTIINNITFCDPKLTTIIIKNACLKINIRFLFKYFLFIIAFNLRNILKTLFI